MPRNPSYHGRPASISVQYTQSRLSRWGFTPVVLEYLRKLRLPERLAAVTIRSAANAHFRPVDKLMTLVTIFVTGIARISHIDRALAGETALAGLLGLDRFPSSDRLYDLLSRVTGWHIRQVDGINRAYLDERPDLGGTFVIADLDLSVRSTEGRKRQGATPGHNPKHKGRDCYQWAVAFVSGLVVWQRLRRGNASGLGLVRPALEALRQRLPRLDLIRLDGGFLSAKVLNDLVKERVSFLTKAGRKLVSIRSLIERTRPRRCLRVHLLDDIPTPVTVVLVECRRRVKKMKKGRLWWQTKLAHYAIVTDLHHWGTARIYETYKKRWAIENFFKESVQSFSSGKLPSATLRGNQFFLALLSLAYNLMQSFKRECLPKGYRSVSFAMVRRHFLEHAVEIEDRGEGIVLIFNSSYPLQRTANLMLRKALAA
jgi:hypothetical protein